MRFDLTAPCDNCPFLREGGIRVHPERARELAESQTEHQGSTFACHKTTVPDLNGEGDLVETPNSQYCGGALAMSAKLGLYNQSLRIAHRLGLWTPSQMTAEGKARVFGSVLEMITAQTPRPLPRSKRPLKHTTPKRRSL